MEREIEQALEGRGVRVRMNSLSILSILDLALWASALWRTLRLLRCVPCGLWHESYGLAGFAFPVLVREKTEE